MKTKNEKSKIVIEGIKEELKDAIAHVQGKLNLRTYNIEIPQNQALYNLASNCCNFLTTGKSGSGIS